MEIRQAPEHEAHGKTHGNDDDDQKADEGGDIEDRARKKDGEGVQLLAPFLGPFAGADHASAETDNPLEI